MWVSMYFKVHWGNKCVPHVIDSDETLVQSQNEQVATSLLTSCNMLDPQINIRLRSHGLRQLFDDKSIASCQQTYCKLIIKTVYPQACCKLSQQVVKSPQMTICNKPDCNRLVAT